MFDTEHNRINSDVCQIAEGFGRGSYGLKINGLDLRRNEPATAGVDIGICDVLDLGDAE